MSKQELPGRVAALERQNRRFRSAASVLGAVLLVLIGVGWSRGTAGEHADRSRDVRARSILLLDATGEPSVRMQAQGGGLRVSMVGAGGIASSGRAPVARDSARADVPASRSGGSLLLHPAPGLVLYGPAGRPVARLGRVEATELAR